MSELTDEQELAALLRALPRAPAAWVAAARAIPRAGRPVAEQQPPAATPQDEAATTSDAVP